MPLPSKFDADLGYLYVLPITTRIFRESDGAKRKSNKSYEHLNIFENRSVRKLAHAEVEKGEQTVHLIVSDLPLEHCCTDHAWTF